MVSQRENLRLRAAAFVLAAIALLEGCSGGRVRAVGQGREALGIQQAAAESVVEEIAARVEALRGLKFLRSVPVAVVSDAWIRDYMLERIEQMGMQESMQSVERVYKLLQLVPDDTDIFEVLVGALEEQAGGFYDPPSGSYYLLDDMPSAMVGMITAHELVHALEDQHFDLSARVERVADSDDRTFAVSAVHEGSATLVMTLYSADEARGGRLDPEEMSLSVPGDALDALPEVFSRQLVGPYVLGLRFLLRGDMVSLAEGFPAEDVRSVFERGPLSSEQILHPEKYWEPASRDIPIPVALPIDDLAGGWTVVAEGDLGELVLAVLVAPGESPDPQFAGSASWTHPAAAGWGGDGWQLLQRGDRSVVRVLTVWDTEKDAQEFRDAMEGRSGMTLRSAGRSVAWVAFGMEHETAALDAEELEALLAPLGSMLK